MPAAFKQALDELKPVRLASGTKGPVLLHEVKPVYPPEAREQKVEGTVTMDVIIDATGSVYEAMVVESIAGLDQAALDAVRQWKFQPALLNGAPMSVVCSVEMSFKLK
jgi:protein TonB